MQQYKNLESAVASATQPNYTSPVHHNTLGQKLGVAAATLGAAALPFVATTHAQAQFTEPWADSFQSVTSLHVYENVKADQPIPGQPVGGGIYNNVGTVFMNNGLALNMAPGETTPVAWNMNLEFTQTEILAGTSTPLGRYGPNVNAVLYGGEAGAPNWLLLNINPFNRTASLVGTKTMSDFLGSSYSGTVSGLTFSQNTLYINNNFMTLDAILASGVQLSYELPSSGLGTGMSGNNSAIIAGDIAVSQRPDGTLDTSLTHSLGGPFTVFGSTTFAGQYLDGISQFGLRAGVNDQNQWVLDQYSISPANIPEPAVAFLLIPGLGLAYVVASRRREENNSPAKTGTSGN